MTTCASGGGRCALGPAAIVLAVTMAVRDAPAGGNKGIVTLVAAKGQQATGGRGGRGAWLSSL